jgi:hypothetical protein
MPDEEASVAQQDGGVGKVGSVGECGLAVFSRASQAG